MAKVRKKKTTKQRPKQKTGAVARQRKTSPKLTDSLQRRLQAEFAESIRRAEMYVADPERLRDLIAEATAQLESMPRQQLRDIWALLQTMLRLVRAYARGVYPSIAPSALLHMVGALLYG